MSRFRRIFTRALCGSAAICLVVPLISLLAVSDSLAQRMEDGRMTFPERRIRAYDYMGADEDIIRMTLARMTSDEGDAPGSWVYEWRVIGEYYEGLGDAATSRQAALDAYMTAGVYYALAWFPRNDSPEKERAYQTQLRVYEKGGKLFDVPLEVVKVPYGDRVITTYLHKPVGVERPPLVVYAGGVDQYKANHYLPVQDFLAKGLAVATFDVPGVGEGRQWERSNTGAGHIAILEHYLTRGDIDTARISLFGQSMGAGSSLQAAMRNDPRVKSVVALCGALHIGGGERSRAPEAKVGEKFIDGPLLVANGTRDGGSPVEDLTSTYEAAREGDLWLMGLGEHCAVEYYPIMMPHIAQWVVEKNSN